MAIAAFIGTAIAADAAAHHLPSERELFIQVDEPGAVALWQIRLHAADAATFAAIWDRDRNAAWSPKEARGAAKALTVKSMAGVQITWDDLPVQPKPFEPRLVDERPRSSTLGANAIMPLSLPTNAEHRHELRISVGARAAPLRVSVTAKGPWQIESWTGPSTAAVRQNITPPFEIQPQGQLHVWLVRADKVRAAKGDLK